MFISDGIENIKVLTIFLSPLNFLVNLNNLDTLRTLMILINYGI
jgi:hypothetical protein